MEQMDKTGKDHDSEVKARVGKIVQRLRYARDVTQEHLSGRIGVKKSTLASWERGSAMVPPGKLELLKNYFGVSWEYLFTGQDREVVADGQSENETFPPDLMRIARVWKHLSSADKLHLTGIAMDMREAQYLDEDMAKAQNG